MIVGNRTIKCRVNTQLNLTASIGEPVHSYAVFKNGTELAANMFCLQSTVPCSITIFPVISGAVTHNNSPARKKQEGFNQYSEVRNDQKGST